MLSADFSNLAKDIEMVNESKAEWFHLDIMDGVFVPNISFGIPVIKAIRQKTRKILDVHLMIVEPDRYVEEFKKAGADYLSVHYEACTHLHRTVYKIKENDMKAGVVLNPHTPVNQLVDIITDLDFVLLMSVNPGFGGQKFIENTYNKVSALKELILAKNSTALIEVDGGISLQNAPKLKSLGVNILVAGNTVFNSPDPKNTIELLLKQ